MFVVPPALMAPPPTVPSVDLQRYMGVWYEVARLPNSFQRGCLRSTATYWLGSGGRFRVLNACQTLNGKNREARGRARVVDPVSGSKIEVTFFWPFWGDYWILGLDPEYRWALVGTPDRKYLWVLSRTETTDPALLDQVLQRARDLGYDLTGLIRN